MVAGDGNGWHVRLATSQACPTRHQRRQKPPMHTVPGKQSSTDRQAIPSPRVPTCVQYVRFACAAVAKEIWQPRPVSHAAGSTGSQFSVQKWVGIAGSTSPPPQTTFSRSRQRPPGAAQSPSSRQNRRHTRRSPSPMQMWFAAQSTLPAGHSFPCVPVAVAGLNTDFQRMAYVLPEGEAEPPAGLRAALARTNAVQDALAAASRPGRVSADVYDDVMAQMKARGIEAMIYSHPLGAQGHALGAAIDFRAAQRKDPPRPLRAGSWLAMELNAATTVPEWDGQKVFVMEEDPVHLTDAGWQFFVPRQSAFLLIK